ncbi:hypothetical protein MP228_009683 [Amoeboaphelidium protococcarum]|nr:hypothetical protein MP228_009683 [Amoeboaphelidium protococcarum]
MASNDELNLIKAAINRDQQQDDEEEYQNYVEALLRDEGNDQEDFDDQLPVAIQSEMVRSYPVTLIEKITRERIFESIFWKQYLSSIEEIDAASILELIMDHVQYISGLYGGLLQVSPFIALVLKAITLGIEKEILLIYIAQKQFKYIRAFGAFILRLVLPAVEVYTCLEQLLADYRKLRVRNHDGSFTIIHMDEFVEQLLTQERVCGVILPRLIKRQQLVQIGQLQPRSSPLNEDDSLSLNDQERSGHNAPIKTFSRESKDTSILDRGGKLRLKQKKPRLEEGSEQHAVQEITPTATETQPSSTSFKSQLSLSVEDMNKLRASLGLPPLK